MWVMPISGTRIAEHSVLTPLPVRSVLLLRYHLAQRGNVTQNVLYFRYCVDTLIADKDSDEVRGDAEFAPALYFLLIHSKNAPFGGCNFLS